MVCAPACKCAPRSLKLHALGYPEHEIIRQAAQARVGLTCTSASLQGGLAGAVMGNRDQRLVLGQYITAGYDKPGSGKCRTIELRDRSVYRDSVHNSPVLARLLPVPRRFREVWRVAKGSACLCVWEAEPPDERYVALGMVATTGQDPAPPPFDSVRCVPREWCETAQQGLEEIWRDGRAGALWRVRQSGLLLAGRGAAPPDAVVLRRALETEEPPPIWNAVPQELLQALFIA
jgi:hypothetical protein